MQRVNLIFGILLLLIFLFTGYFMLTGFPELYSDYPEIRMMFRANHIYILFASLINILLGVLKFNAAGKLKNNIRLISSSIVLAGSILLVAAFFIEPPAASFERPLTFLGVVTNLGGIILMAVIQLLPASKKGVYENEN